MNEAEIGHKVTEIHQMYKLYCSMQAYSQTCMKQLPGCELPEINF